MMKKALTILALAVLGLAQMSSAQPVSMPTQVLYAQYDLDSTTATSCSYGPKTRVGGLATTSGSSTTTTSVSSSAVFDSVAVGDLIWASISGVETGRLITARASDDSATVHSAWTLPAAGVSIMRQARTCGASSGWVAVGDASIVELTAQINQLSLSTGAVAMQIQGATHAMLGTSTPTNLWPGESSADAKCNAGTFASGYCTYTTAGIGTRVIFSTMGIVHVDYIRLVVDLTGNDDGSDTGADAEQIDATLRLVRGN